MKIHILDAKNMILGRLAVKAAILLRGKDKKEYVPYKDCGDKVVIINTDKVKVTGKKLKQKLYITHSGYPGSIKQRTLAEKLKQDSRKVIYAAIYGMLPKNKLRDKIIKKLTLYHADQK